MILAKVVRGVATICDVIARAILGALLCAAALADDLKVRAVIEVPPETCLATSQPCPTVAGRYVQIDQTRAAFLDRVGTSIETFFCTSERGWKCRFLAVGAGEDDEVEASAALRQILAARRVRIEEDFGGLRVAEGRPPSCGEDPSRGCEFQSVRVLVGVPGDRASQQLHRAFWLVDQADGTLLRCTNEALRACDRMNAAAWVALVASLRPGAQAPPLPDPEVGPVQRRGGAPGRVAAGPPQPASSLDGEPMRPPGVGPDAPDPDGDASWAQPIARKAGRCLDPGQQVTLLVTFRADGRVDEWTTDNAALRARMARCVEEALAEMRAPAVRQGPYLLRLLVSR